MCRFVAYIGRPMLMDELIIKPKNSLINQSVQASEMEEPLNGDGFGVAWYNHDISPDPGLFVSVKPAWNDQNLNYLAKKIESNCFFAHVRAANVGWVSEANCHPFRFNHLVFMHNGQIGSFKRIKRQMRRELNDQVYDWVTGQTDSEHLFGLFLNIWTSKERNGTAIEMAEVLEETIQRLQKISDELNITEKTYINAVLTDGKRMVAVRYTNDKPENASTLYYSSGSKYICEGDTCRMRDTQDPNDHAVLIVSEKLTLENNDWKEIFPNHILIVDIKLQTSLRPIEFKT